MGRTRRGFKRLPVRMWVTFYAITLPVPVVHKQCKFRYAGHFWQRFFISWINGAIFYLHDVNFWLSCFGPSFRYNLVTIGVLEFVVVIDVYAQPTREKIKFYWTASEYHSDAFDNLAGTMTITDDAFQRRQHLVKIRSLPVEPANARIGMCDLKHPL